MELVQPLHAPGFSLRQLNGRDWLYALVVLAAAGVAYSRYGHAMDGYEQGILAGSALGLIALGWFWKSWQWYFPLSGALALGGLALYGDDLARGQTSFGLKFLLSSQSAIMWMCFLYFLATAVYWLGLLRRSDFLNRVGSGLTWAATVLGLTGLFVRWGESYLIGADVGHIPVSNLYEVFVLFCLITALMYLYYEARYQARQMGAFVLVVISAAVGFILWYTFDRQAHEIQPLIPALQSWWMKIHVPANFVGYGAFALSAMLGVAELLAMRGILTSKLPKPEVIAKKPVEQPKPKPVPTKPVEVQKPVEAKPQAGQIKTMDDLIASKMAQPTTAPAAAAPAQGSWILQLGAFKNADSVNALVSKLRAAGYSAQTSPRTPVQGQINRVFIGPDVSKAKLQGMQSRISQMTGLSGSVVAYNP